MNFTEQLNEVGIVLNDTQRSQFDIKILRKIVCYGY